MFYDGYHLWGMHLFWWLFWFVIIFWLFATPSWQPAQRKKKDSPVDILKRRLASGDITKEDYLERKKLLESNDQEELK